MLVGLATLRIDHSPGGSFYGLSMSLSSVFWSQNIVRNVLTWLSLIERSKPEAFGFGMGKLYMTKIARIVNYIKSETGVYISAIRKNFGKSEFLSKDVSYSLIFFIWTRVTKA